MKKPSILIAHPYLSSSGGSNTVAAWAIQALRDDYEITLGTLGAVGCDALNHNFGTSLRREDFNVRIAPAHWRGMAQYMPTQGALLSQCITMRWARTLDREYQYDALMSTENECDFGRKGLQYIHFPWFYLPRPEIELQWFHHIPGVLHGYRNLCESIAGATADGLRRNISLANSAFIADRIQSVHKMPAKVLHPPVPGGFPVVPFAARIQGMISLGRMDHVKRWENAVEIVDRVRSGGIDISLTLISHRHDEDYARRIETLAATRPWFRILYDLPRAQLVQEVARHRFGLHTMEEEHFGIAPAELQRAGCITFVHRSGGPMEIVGHREELMFDNSEQASERICRVIRDAALQDELRQFAEERGRHFSAERFCAELRERVAEISQLSPFKEGSTRSC